MNVSFGASEADIKKRFRKLANLHHPDKNSGSLKSEETFKIILKAYEVLSDKNSRVAYDFEYKKYFDLQNDNKIHNKSRPNCKEQKNSQDNRQADNQQKKKTANSSGINYGYWLILLIIIYFYNSNKSNNDRNAKAFEQLKNSQNVNRPQSGELDFTKKNTKTDNIQESEQLENSQNVNRPQSGELDFTKKKIKTSILKVSKNPKNQHPKSRPQSGELEFKK